MKAAGDILATFQNMDVVVKGSRLRGTRLNVTWAGTVCVLAIFDNLFNRQTTPCSWTWNAQTQRTSMCS